MGMDWTEMITALCGFVAGGGLVTVFTLRDRKSGAVLDNLKSVMESSDRANREWQEIADDRAKRADELKADLDRRDGKIDGLYREVSLLRDRLDERNGVVSRLKLLKCERMECTRRKPPVGVFAELEADTERVEEENREGCPAERCGGITEDGHHAGA